MTATTTPADLMRELLAVGERLPARPPTWPLRGREVSTRFPTAA